MSFIKKIMSKSPAIMAGLAVVGVVMTAYEAIKAKPKADLNIENATVEKGEELTKKEKAVVLAKSYWKPIATGVVTIACIFTSVGAGNAQRAAAHAAYELSTTALTSQSDAIVKKYGKNALEQLRGTAAGDALEKTLEKMKLNPLKEKKIIKPKTSSASNDTDTVHYVDAWTGRMFESTPVKILEGLSEANKMIRHNDELTINEFFDAIPTKHYDDDNDHSRMGDKYGWSTYKGEIELEYKIIGNKIIDGKDYHIMGFNVNPTERLYS